MEQGSVSQVSMISLEARFTARLPDGRAVFVKASRCDLPRRRSHAALRCRKDGVCLDALAGLAVPRRVKLPRSFRCAGLEKGVLVAEERVPGAALDAAGLSRRELLGAWAFIVEQLAAFRRRQILYTDLKCGNVLATRRPLSVTLIDFDFATAVSDADVYPPSSFGLTQGFESPEHATARRLSEAAVVYQLGMLLLHCWTGADNAELKHPRHGLPRLKKELERLGAASVARLASSCLSADWSKRPRGYEHVLGALRRAALPKAAQSAWDELRRPYRPALAELGLDA